MTPEGIHRHDSYEAGKTSYADDQIAGAWTTYQIRQVQGDVEKTRMVVAKNYGNIMVYIHIVCINEYIYICLYI